MINLTNGELTLAVCPPETVQGTRFSRAGVIAQATYQGHTWFGEWQEKTPPPGTHDAVTGPASEFGMGINGMPEPLGFADAAPGDTFVKVGVGVLRRPDDTPYSFAGAYEIVEVPAWTVTADARRVQMQQQLRHNGYGYRYTYTLEIAADQPTFVTRHTLENIGEREIAQAHYAHNFFVFDNQPVGKGCEVCFPFIVVPCRFLNGEMTLEDGCLRFTSPTLIPGAIFTELDGFGTEVADNAFCVHNHNAGIGVKVVGDRPLTRFHFFATRRTICPEPFVAFQVAPGEAFNWQHQYELQVY